MVNGGSGFDPTDQQETRAAARSFPDQASVEYLRHLGVRAVVVIKDEALNSQDYSRAAQPDVDISGLDIQREDDGDTIVYTLS
jgi:hypothetical protein